MDKRIHHIFDNIYAEDELKRKTSNYLQYEIRKRRKMKRTIKFKLVNVCISFVIFFIIIGFSYNLYFTPNFYIDMDINPSIELSINRFGRIIDANSYNDDGENILQTVNISHLYYEKGIKELLDIINNEGYFEQDNLLSITIQTKNNTIENNIILKLETSVDSFAQLNQSEITTDIFPITEEIRNSAYENNISPAKYLAIYELQQIDPTANFDKCAKHSISEIRQLTQESNGHHHGEKHFNNNNIGNEELESEIIDDNIEDEELELEIIDDNIENEITGNNKQEGKQNRQRCRHRSGHN